MLDPRLPERQKLTGQAWKVGALSYKLYSYQQPIHDALWSWIRDPECLKGCVNVSRQFGKTTTTNLVNTEVCIRAPGAKVRFAGPSGKQLKKLTLPTMKWILADCPKELRPKWHRQDLYFEFPNGSEYHLAGANDGHADNLRGTGAHVAGVDEAGFVDELEYLVHSILMPQTLTTGGTLLLLSTPPKTPAHDYVGMALDCELRGNYIHRTVYDTDFTEQRVAQIAHDCGGFDTTTFKREYLAQFVVDENLAIVPEWNSENFVRDTPRGQLWPFWHRYESLDIGVRDFTVVLFAYYDFQQAKLIVEDELVMQGSKVTSDALAVSIREREQKLGYSQGSGLYRRVSDNNNLVLLNDLAALQSMPFSPTSKDELWPMVNELRMWVRNGRVLVHPRCRNLIGCLKNGIWRTEKAIGRDFARTKEYAHFDALAALIYLVRNIDQHSNPVPVGYGIDPATHWLAERHMDHASETGRELRNIFGLKG